MSFDNNEPHMSVFGGNDAPIISFAGRLAMDAELRYTKEGKPLFEFSWPWQKKPGKPEHGGSETFWYKCTLWINAKEPDKILGLWTKFLKKGNMISVTGSLEPQSYISASTGKVGQSLSVNVIRLAAGGVVAWGDAPADPDVAAARDADAAMAAAASAGARDNL